MWLLGVEQKRKAEREGIGGEEKEKEKEKESGEEKRQSQVLLLEGKWSPHLANDNSS